MVPLDYRQIIINLPWLWSMLLRLFSLSCSIALVPSL